MRFLFIFLLSITTKVFAINAYEPVAIDSRIKTFIYSENDIYNLKFRIGYQSIIEFSKDESIELISIGDPYPWKLTPIGTKLFLKPIEPGVKTNMTVETNKRVYLFEIESDLGANEESIDVMHVARFFYPSTTVDTIDSLGSSKSVNRTKDIIDQKKTSDTISNVNIMYSFVGRSNPSTPVEIFDDRDKTYIRFKTEPNYQNLRIFTFKEGKREVVKFKKTGDFIILNGVFSKMLIDYDGFKTEVYNDYLSL